MLSLILLLSCETGLLDLQSEAQQAEYDARKQAALQVATGIPQGWEPDSALRLSPAMLLQLVAPAVRAKSKSADPITVRGVGTIKPVLTLERLKFVAGECAGCIGVQGKVSGLAHVKVSALRRKVPFTSTFTMDMSVVVTHQGEQVSLAIKPEQVRTLKVKFEGLAAWKLDGPLERYGEQVLERIDPISLGSLGSAQLRLRDLRVKHEGGCLRVELLTDSAQSAPLQSWPGLPTRGFQAVLSQQTMLTQARREAFALGDVSQGLGIYVEPTSFHVRDQSFEMDMRIWGLTGLQWWREYSVSGELNIENGEVRLKATDVTPGAISENAQIVEPLALLAEGLVLETITRAASSTLPASQEIVVGNKVWTVELQEAQGMEGNLVLGGRVGVK